MRIYAIGDIHGHLDKLEQAHRLIEADRARAGDSVAPVVHLGDLVDRGPDSAGVVDYLIRGIEAGAPWIVLKGNHDRMFTGFMSDPDHQDPGLRADLHWTHPRLGGDATLASYGVPGAGERLLHDLHEEARARVPERHLHFLRSLPSRALMGEVLFVHAGIRPGIPLADQVEDDLLWIRRPFLDWTGDHGVLVVHGHTAVEAPEHHGNRVNLDSGAGYGRALTAAVFEERRAFVLTPEGRIELAPAT